LGIDRGFVIAGTAHDRTTSDQGYLALYALDFGEARAADLRVRFRLACNYKKSYIHE
jgi:hypothetical protein